MRELFRFFCSLFKRSGESDTEAYYSSILCMAVIRLALFYPLVRFCADLLNCKLNKVSIILYLIICLLFSYFRAPQKQSLISNKKYDNISKLTLYVIAFLIVFLSGIGGAVASILVDKYFVEPYGLEGWLLQFFKWNKTPWPVTRASSRRRTSTSASWIINHRNLKENECLAKKSLSLWCENK